MLVYIVYICTHNICANIMYAYIMFLYMKVYYTHIYKNMHTYTRTINIKQRQRKNYLLFLPIKQHFVYRNVRKLKI